jgi:anti-sigma factor RsiW
MNCELAHERIVTAAYGELSDELVHELDRHLTGCTQCQSESEQVVALKVLADAHPVIEPGPNLVARARLRLDEALDALPPKQWYERLGERMLNNFASLQGAPAAAVLLLVAGAGAGLLGGYRVRAEPRRSCRCANCVVFARQNQTAAPQAALRQCGQYLLHRAPA